MDHPIHNLMKISMENIKDMIDVNTIVGEAVEVGIGGTIIPISRVRFGFAAGGTEVRAENRSNDFDNKKPFGGGAGGTVAIQPIAFLVVKDGKVDVLHLETQTHLYEKLIDLAPQVAEKFKNLVPPKIKEEADRKINN